MEAQRAPAWQAVESYERKRALVSFAVRAHEHALHEAHVSVERVHGGGAGLEVRADPGQNEIGFTDKSIEVVDE